VADGDESSATRRFKALGFTGVAGPESPVDHGVTRTDYHSHHVHVPKLPDPFSMAFPYQMSNSTSKLCVQRSHFKAFQQSSECWQRTEPNGVCVSKQRGCAWCILYLELQMACSHLLHYESFIY
jgi:hypothetical protein